MLHEYGQVIYGNRTPTNDSVGGDAIERTYHLYYGNTILRKKSCAADAITGNAKYPILSIVLEIGHLCNSLLCARSLGEREGSVMVCGARALTTKMIVMYTRAQSGCTQGKDRGLGQRETVLGE